MKKLVLFVLFFLAVGVLPATATVRVVSTIQDFASIADSRADTRTRTSSSRSLRSS
jgi:hypothetical protein